MKQKILFFILSSMHISLFGIHINELLFKAVRDGKIKEVEWCLDHGANMDALIRKCPFNSTHKMAPFHRIFGEEYRRYGRSSLHIAVLNGHYRIVCLLLKHGAHKDLPDSNGYNPIDTAIMLGNLPMVKLFFNKDDTFIFRYIHDVIKYNHFDIFAFLLSQLKIFLVIHHALPDLLKKNRIKMLKYFTQWLESKNARITCIHTNFLHLSIQCGNSFFARYLLEHGFDPNKYRYCSAKPELPALHQAAASGNMNLVRLLLAYGADINLQAEQYIPDENSEENEDDEEREEEGIYKNKGTALYHAAANDHVAIAKFLLQNGAWVEEDDLGNPLAKRPIEKAWHPQIIYWLILYGAKPTIKYPIKSIVRYNNEISFDMAYNFDLWGAGKKKKLYSQGLFVAAYFNDYELMQKLFEQGADANVINSAEDMPLTVALQQNNLACAYRLLIATNVKKDKHGKLPLDYAQTPAIKNMIAWYTQDRHKFYHLGLILAARHGDGDLIKYCVGHGYVQNMNKPVSVKSNKRKWMRDHGSSKRLKRV